jgi:hypothetical protein
MSVKDKSKPACGCFNSRSLIAHGRPFVRAQSAIRADGPPSAQAGSLALDAIALRRSIPVWRTLRAPRANRVFWTDKNHPSRKRGY